MGARQRPDGALLTCDNANGSADDEQPERCRDMRWKSLRNRFFLLFIITLRVGIDGMLIMTLSFVFRDEPFVCSAGASPSGAEPFLALQSDSASSCAACERSGTAEIFSPYSASVSAAATYHLVCSRVYIVAVIKSAFFFGMGIGGSVGGHAAEKFGRRRTCYSFTPIISWPALAFFVLGNGGVSLGIGYAISGFSVGFHLVPLYLIVVEIFDDVADWRSKASSIMWVGWCFMVASVSAIAFGIDSLVHASIDRGSTSLIAGMPAWRALILVVFAGQVLIVALIARYLPESPVWLRSNGRDTERLEVMEYLTGDRAGVPRGSSRPSGSGGTADDVDDANRFSSQSDLQRLLSPIDETSEVDSGSESGTGSPLSVEVQRQRQGSLGEDAAAALVKDSDGQSISLFSARARHLGRPVIFLTLSTIVSWFSVSLVYYGLFLNSASFSDSLYIGNTISTLEQVFPYYYGSRVMDTIGRRRTQAFCFAVGAVACFLCALPLISDAFKNVLALLALLVISISFGVVYTYTNELYPVALRGQALGLGILASRAGSVLAPQVQILLGAIHPSVPAFVFSVASLLAVAANLALPETKDL